MCLTCELNYINKEFRLFGQKWGDSQLTGSFGGQVTYSFANQNFPDQFGAFDTFITEHDFQDEVIESLAAWENIANIRFINVPDSGDVDIRFGWRDIDGPGNILGQTTIPASGELKNVVVALDVDENWFLLGDAPVDKVDFSSTVTHEIGHAIGIDHSASTEALMHANYSTSNFNLSDDDIDAAVAIYGQVSQSKTDIHRFFNPQSGGHFFTASTLEKNAVEGQEVLRYEGVGFIGLASEAEDDNGAVPVYRFYNKELGSHLFTAFEAEKDHLATLDNYIYEGVGFKAFLLDSSSTTAVHRFFDTASGGHFFTADPNEKLAVLGITQFRYEGEAFYCYSSMTA